ncbi:MAG TPA: VIT1/CCC1 transporter family protein [Dictyoglomaceae bacterium]|nr:VIT1/CCC1 transporter family protein [Dictyoglomaceae bacterium]HOL39364.1 VIT1/CCC1 transporter family protein [Dictyoglomaceae bacterium]HOP94821.1 VIT1/CCC1 transporter family protein [Dictyoglomaceae bacterium]HPP15954.1 VIT1/CCC1 transporter family protein [Dictyoglomaceae bacterium]HPU43284.1 VIT1/CCC1 transporter family protein [Dictyoglomaceae bacterium]
MKEETKILEIMQRNEITEHFIYKKLSSWEKDKENKKIFDEIAADELKHYNVLKNLSNKDITPNKFKIFIYLFLEKIFGFTFILKLMETGEDNAIKGYSSIINSFPEIKKILEDEEKHEQKLLSLLNEERLNYVGSMVLGLSDALVELTGTLAGLTFAFQNTKLISLSGLITGIAAALSMACSEYLSVKAEEGDRNPLKAALITGLTYIMAVIVLILPYFLTQNYVLALVFCLLFSSLLVLVFNYYISVAKDLDFKKRFLEMIIIIFSVSFISFIIGLVVKKAIGIDI